jgi:hypothetical protein
MTRGQKLRTKETTKEISNENMANVTYGEESPGMMKRNEFNYRKCDRKDGRRSELMQMQYKP